MTADTSALWILFSLGATTWAADTGISFRSVAVAAAAAVSVVVVAAVSSILGGPALTLLSWLAAPEVVALALTAASLVRVLTSHGQRAGGAIAGLLIGGWAVHLGHAGAPFWLIPTLAFPGPALAAWWATRRNGFVPEDIRSEALLLVAALGLAVASVPTLLDGWRSASTLAAASGAPAAATTIPTFAMLTTGGAIALGGLHAAWRRW